MKGQDYTAATDFLIRFFGGTEHDIELRSFDDNSRSRAQAEFGRTIEDFQDHCEIWDKPGRGMYFGCATRLSDKRKGDAAHCVEVPAVWGDIDVYEIGRTKEEAIEALNAFHMPPTLVIDSGGGVQAFWMLTEPATVADDADDLKAALREIARVFCGDPKVVDLARVMRLPGTINAKAKHGGEVRIAALLSDNAREYELSDLIEGLSEAQPLLTAVSHETKAIEQNPFEAFGEERGEGVDVVKVIDEMEDGNIHHSQVKLTAKLVSEGVDDDEIVERVMAATRAAAGVEGGSWDWRAEEKAVRIAIKGAHEKGFSPSEKWEKQKEAIKQMEQDAVDGELEPRGNPDWMDKADKDKKGEKILNTLHNIELIASEAPPFADRFALNELRLQIQVEDLPWDSCGPRDRDDDDMSSMRAYIQKNYGFKPSKDDLYDMVSVVAKRRAFNPVIEYLDAQAWDGKERIGSWLIDYMGAEDTPFNRAVGKAWLVGAVKRAYQPGCQMDYMLILEGAQGVGKSTGVQALCPSPDWFTDNLPGLVGRKENFEAITGRWIVEVGELASMRKSEVDEAKAFLTSKSDNYRPPYARTTKDNPRRCVFVGTANESSRGHFKDDSGNRRFWFVRVEDVDVEGIRRDRGQLWAEAVQAMRDGAASYLTDRTLAAEGERIAAEHSAGATDPWLNAVERYITHSPSTDFGSNQVDHPSKWALRSEPLDRIRLSDLTDILRDAIGVDLKSQRGEPQSRVVAILTYLGWKRKKARELGAGAKSTAKWHYVCPSYGGTWGDLEGTTGEIEGTTGENRNTHGVKPKNANKPRF